jgi:alpha,alpha-trehalase
MAAAAFAVATLSAICQSTTGQPQAAAIPAAPHTGSISTYIQQSWDTLSRSMNQCDSVVDAKVTTVPVMYIPIDVAEPAELQKLHTQCNVKVEHLPKKMEKLGDLAPGDIPTPGLLYLPNKYVVPGGRFNEMFGWDSYFIILGLVDDGRIDFARGMVENFFYEIEHYGAVLNANRTYFLTRSQPPLLTSMVRAVYDAELQRDPSEANRKKQDAWLAKAYSYVVRDHSLWERDFHRAGDTGLARYFDLGEGPVPDIADHSDYYQNVITWLLSHPDVKTDYLVKSSQNPSPDEAAQLAKTSCDISASTLCKEAWVGGYRLSYDFYKGDRAVRESGFDVSFRFGPFSGSTERSAPVCLNSLLYKYENDLALFATKLGKPAEAARWTEMANARKAAMQKYLWNEQKGLFVDYDFTTDQQSTYVYASTFYPLWAGLATKEQATALEKNLPLLNRPGGLACSQTASGLQWDLPFGWAPLQWFAMQGFTRYGDGKDARLIATEWSKTVLDSFKTDDTIHEKYNVVSGNSDVQVIAGYKTNLVGFGWTNGVYLEMQKLLKTGPVH